MNVVFAGSTVPTTMMVSRKKPGGAALKSPACSTRASPSRSSPVDHRMRNQPLSSGTSVSPSRTLFAVGRSMARPVPSSTSRSARPGTTVCADRSAVSKANGGMSTMAPSSRRSTRASPGTVRSTSPPSMAGTPTPARALASGSTR
jgi:hypothetical protein